MDSKSIFSFLQPSLLSREQIIEILIERCISKDLLIDKGKDELVEIFERVAKPLTCRGTKRKSKQSGISVSLTEKRVVKSVNEISSDINTGKADSNIEVSKKSTIISLTKRIKREPEKSPVPSKAAKMEHNEDTKLKEETSSTKKKKWTKIVW